MDHPKPLIAILGRVDPGSGRFRTGPMGNGAFIQYERENRRATIGDMRVMRGRKWYVSKYATEQEIFRTCFLAVLTYEQHEVHERFRVDGQRFLSPHPEGMREEGVITWEHLF